MGVLFAPILMSLMRLFAEAGASLTFPVVCRRLTSVAVRSRERML